MISVVIPVYNVEKYLYECIESVLDQNYDDFEIILVNDGSTDNSGKICDAYAEKDKRITVIHKKNAGLVKARLTGVENAHGQYIVSLDSDDVLYDGLLAHLSEIIKEHEPQIICYELQEFGIKDAKKRENKYKEGLYSGVLFQNILKTYLCNENEVFFTAGIIYGIVTKAVQRRLILDALKNTPSEISLGEDLAITALLLKNAINLYITHFIGYGYRQIAGSLSHKYSPKTIDELKRLVQLISDAYLGSIIREIPAGQIEKYVSFRLIKFMSDIACAEKISESFRLLKKIDKEILSYVRKTELVGLTKSAHIKISLLKSRFRVLLLLIFRIKYKRI
jgi:glycosyltransferase